MPQKRRKNKNGWVGCWSRAAVWNLKCPLFLFYSQDISTPETSPERPTLLEMTTIMCELKRRVSHSMNSTCKNRHKVPRGGGTVTWQAQQQCPWFACQARLGRITPRGDRCSPNVRKCTTQMSVEGLYFSVVRKCRGEERAVMLGVVFHNGPGVPAVLALSRPVGLKVPSPHRVSTSNSWRSLSTAKVGGMLGQVAPAQYLNTFLSWTTSGAAWQRQPDS